MLAQLEPSVLISRWLHFAAFIVAVGGTIFIRLLLIPALRALQPGDAGQPLRDTLFRRWGHVLHTSIAVLLLTGIYNAFVQFPRHQPVPSQVPLYHVLFGVKMLLVFALFFIAIAVTGRSRTFEAVRRHRPAWLTVSIVLAAAIVLLSNLLKLLPVTS